MSRGWSYKSGDWWVTCGVCGKQTRASKIKKRWDGFLVCPEDYETRHPQDLIKHRAEKTSVPFSREEPTDTFTTVNYTDIYEQGTTYSIGDSVIYGQEIYYSIVDSNVGNIPIASGGYWAITYSATTSYADGDAVYYGGEVFYSQQNGNIGNIPFDGSSYWGYTWSSYDEATTYEIGETVVYESVTYYSLAGSNIGNNPSSTPMWSTSAPGVSRFYGDCAGYYGSSCSTREAAGYSAWRAHPHTSCATKNGASYTWITYDSISTSYSGAPWFYSYALVVHQWVDNPPWNCTGGTIDGGLSPYGAIVQTA